MHQKIIQGITILFFAVLACSLSWAQECGGECETQSDCLSCMDSCMTELENEGTLEETLESIIRREGPPAGASPLTARNLEACWCSACCEQGYTGNTETPCIFSCPCTYNESDGIPDSPYSDKRPTLNQSTRVITDTVNYNVCLALNTLWMVIPPIAVLVMIYAGLKYTGAASDATQRSRSKKTVLYAVIALVLSVVSCPAMDYLITNTDIVPLKESCGCFQPMEIRKGSSPVMPNISNVSTRPPTSSTLPLPNGASCRKDYQCASGICSNFFCCDPNQCGYAYTCYNETQERQDGLVCKLGDWKKQDGMECRKDSECLSDNCNMGVCCPESECGYEGECYAEGYEREDEYMCRDEQWISTATTTSTTTTTRPTTKKLRVVFVRLDNLDVNTFNSAADSHADFMLDNLPLRECPEAFEYVKLEENCAANVPYDETTCISGSTPGNIIRAIQNCASRAGAYDYAVGLSDRARCGSRVQGFSTNIAGAVYVKYPYNVVTVHELGHQWGLNDEYCSQLCSGCPAGNPNPLSSAQGCNPNPGGGCCGQCKGYDIQCYGNTNSEGGRCIMSYANAPSPRGFCELCYNHLKTIPKLNCG